MNRQRAALAAFLVLAVVATLIRVVREGPTPDGSFDPRMATTNAGDRGVRAMYFWLGEMGYETSSWRKSFSALDDDVPALFVLDPTEPVSEKQADRLREWLESGERFLFVAPGESESLRDLVSEWVHFDVDGTRAIDVPGDRRVVDDRPAWLTTTSSWRYREATFDERGLYAYPVGEIAFASDERVSAPDPDTDIAFARPDHGLVAERWVGDSMVIVAADPEMFTNYGIQRADNVEFLAGLLETWLEDGTEIWFDDGHHGERTGGDLATYLLRRRPGLFAAAFAVVGVLLVLRFGRGLLRAPEEARRRRLAEEFVEALGHLYGRSGAVEAPWRSLSTVADRLLAMPPPPTADVARRERRESLRVARDVASPREYDLIRLARAVADHLEPREGAPAPLPRAPRRAEEPT